ncbi:TAXI family TRAP transporter solute-binding subunit [Henriciella sp. AS95]|uniref:ABC transporter substrate-binding protein n=1 Tax=Henriciella sp. AS95 TaxID=3135782 RepID=UPI003173F3BF
MLDAHNRSLAAQLESCDAFGTVETKPVALPGAIDEIRRVDPTVRPYHLPIMTVLDFQTAIDGTAPDWHAYSPPVSDLKFVADLYDVAFGILVFDENIKSFDDLRGRRIGVPARASSVRWFTEVLLRDGWGILDEVTLVDIAPPDLPAAIASGEIDATSWSIMSETPDGFLPLIPPLLSVEGAHWIDADEATLDAINAASPFQTEIVKVSRIAGSSSSSANLLSFKQGLAAWSDTPGEVVESVVDCLEGADLGFGDGPHSLDSSLDWPGLRNGDIHPALVEE